MNDLPILPFESEAAWERWLEAHHADSQGVWLKIGKKASGQEFDLLCGSTERGAVFWLD